MRHASSARDRSRHGSAARRRAARQTARLAGWLSLIILLTTSCGEPVAGGRSATEWEILLRDAPGRVEMELLAQGGGAGEVLVRLCRSEHTRIRELASELLAQHWRGSAMHRSDVQRELRVLAGDPDEHVRRNAGIGLVRVMAEEVAPDEALTALLDDESGAGAGAAAELAWAFPVSARLEEAVSRWEPGTRPSVERCEVLLALGAGGPEVLAEVRRLLLDPETTSAIRVRLLRSIVRSSRTAIALRSELISRLRDATAREERFLAALGLLASSAVASDAPVDEIPHAVPKDDIGVRIAIDLARARIGRSSPDPDLLAEGRTCSFQSVQLRVAQWDLSLRPEDEWAVGVVRDCLRSRVAGLRCEAISGMIMLGTRPSVLASEVERMRGEDEIWRVVQEARRFLAR